MHAANTDSRTEEPTSEEPQTWSRTKASKDQPASTPTQAVASLVGQVVADRYQILGVLGAGSSATVYHARHLRLQREVALKVLAPALRDVKQVAARFLREAQLVSSLSHPNIVQVLDANESPEHGPYLVMEHLQGSTLETVMSEDRLLSTSEVARIISELASALTAMHSRQIVHRDLKPANVICLKDGSIKVVDFGIGKCQTDRSALTSEFSVMGTLHYMPPEQAQGASAEAGSAGDQFSLAVIAYEMLSDRLPFEGSSVISYLQSLKAGPPNLQIEGHPAPAVNVVLRRALSVRAAERYPDAHNFARALRIALHETLSTNDEANSNHSARRLSRDAHASRRDALPDALGATVGDWRTSEGTGKSQRLVLCDGHDVASATSTDEAFLLSRIGDGIELKELFDACYLPQERVVILLTRLTRRGILACTVGRPKQHPQTEQPQSEVRTK